MQSRSLLAIAAVLASTFVLWTYLSPSEVKPTGPVAATEPVAPPSNNTVADTSAASQDVLALQEFILLAGTDTKPPGSANLLVHGKMQQVVVGETLPDTTLTLKSVTLRSATLTSSLKAGAMDLPLSSPQTLAAAQEAARAAAATADEARPAAVSAANTVIQGGKAGEKLPPEMQVAVRRRTLQMPGPVGSQ